MNNINDNKFAESPSSTDEHRKKSNIGLRNLRTQKVATHVDSWDTESKSNSISNANKSGTNVNSRMRFSSFHSQIFDAEGWSWPVEDSECEFENQIGDEGDRSTRENSDENDDSTNVVDTVLQSSWKALTSLTSTITNAGAKIDDVIEDSVRKVAEFAEEIMNANDFEVVSGLGDDSDPNCGPRHQNSSIETGELSIFENVGIDKHAAEAAGTKVDDSDVRAFGLKSEVFNQKRSLVTSSRRRSVSVGQKKIIQRPSSLSPIIRRQKSKKHTSKSSIDNGAKNASNDKSVDSNSIDLKAETEIADVDADKDTKPVINIDINPTKQNNTESDTEIDGSSSCLILQLTNQLTELMKQKSILTRDNDKLMRENDKLHELLDYMMHTDDKENLMTNGQEDDVNETEKSFNATTATSATPFTEQKF